MKILKIIVFIIVAVVFIASTSLFIEERHVSDVGGAGGGLILIFVFLSMVISGIITLIVLLKSPRLYSYIFFGMLTILFLYLGVQKIIAMNKDRLIYIENAKDYEADKILENTWAQIDKPIEVDSLLQTISNETEQINQHKAARYLALSFKDPNYKPAFTKAIAKTPNRGCIVVSYLLENYKLSTEEELLSLFKVLKNYDQVSNLDYCIPREQKADFTFTNLIEKEYYKAAIASFAFRELDFKKYYKKINKIDNEIYRKQAIITLLNKVDFYYQDWNETYTITKLAPTILALKNERGFSDYLIILEQKLKQAIAKSNANEEIWKVYNNQPTQEKFIKVQQLLGEKHSLLQLIPKHITVFYQDQEKEIVRHGKNNYILYRNFLSSIKGDLEHIHAYTYEFYRIYSNGKLVHEGISNQFGYINYKAYGAKADDLIQIETYPTGRKEQRVGWISLLAPWDTYRGMKDRNDAIGHSSKGYTLERAKKAKLLFDTYMDEKYF